MKRENLVVGQKYLAKIGRDWKPVRLESLRDDVPEPPCALVQSSTVIVRTESGNLIYREPSELRRAP